MFRPIRLAPNLIPNFSRGMSRSSNSGKKDARGFPTTAHPNVEPYHPPAAVGEASHKAEFAEMAKDHTKHRNVKPHEPSPVATDMDLKVPKIFRGAAGLDKNDDQQIAQPGHKQPVYTTTPHGPQYVDPEQYKSQQRQETIALSDPPKSTTDKYPRSHKLSHNVVDNAKNLESHHVPRDVKVPPMDMHTITTNNNRSQDDHNLQGQNMGHVLGGYKATLSNPNASVEAKQHAQQVLEQYGALHHEASPLNNGSHLSSNYAPGYTPYQASSNTSVHDSSHASQHNSGSIHEPNTGNVMGGYKATIHNPRTSPEAKEHSQQMLNAMENAGEIHHVDATKGFEMPQEMMDPNAKLRAPRSNVATDMDLKVPDMLKGFAGMKPNEKQNQDQGDQYGMEYRTTDHGPEYVHTENDGSNMARMNEDRSDDNFMEHEAPTHTNSHNGRGRSARR